MFRWLELQGKGQGF